MTALIVLAWIFGPHLLAAVPAWQLGYVLGYEYGAREWSARGHEHHHTCGVHWGLVAVALGPVAVPAILVRNHLTPTPPTLQAQLDAEAAKRAEAERAASEARLRELEAEYEADLLRQEREARLREREGRRS